MLYAGDTTIVSRSLVTLAEMMSVVMEVCGGYGLTVAKRKTETMVMRPLHHAQEDFEIMAAGERFSLTEQFVYLAGTVTEEANVTAAVRCCRSAA